jgi:N-acetylneuraminic acid mutarotase
MKLVSNTILVLLVAGTVAHAADAKTSYPPLPVAVSSFGAAEADGFVYVYGGHAGVAHQYSTETMLGKLLRLNVASPSKGWEELPSGPPLQGLAMVAHGGKLYRIGGMYARNKAGEEADTVSVATCAVFDPKTSKWSALPDLPHGRSSHDAVVVGERIVVAGGWCLNGRGKDREWHYTTLILDLSQKSPKWESIDQPFQRRALNVAALGDKAYVICGLAESGSAERTVDVLDLNTRKWSKGPEIPEGKMNGFTPAACTSGGRIYVSPADGKVYRLKEKQDGWEAIATLEKPRFVHRMVPVGKSTLLVLGGASRGGNVAETEAIELGSK